MPETLLGILKKTTAFFEQKGISDARFQAEQLLAHGLNVNRMELYLQFDRPLIPDELNKLRALVARRAKREPLQHIIGEVGFRHILLQTDARALIPRPDSEHLVDIGLKFLSKHAEPNILEIGVGSGAVILSFAHELPKAQCHGIDISPDALALCQENQKKCELQITVELADLWPSSNQYDLIVCNPPYISEKDWNGLEPEVKDFDPKSALVAEDNGLAIYKRLFEGVATYLKEGGALLIEFGFDQKDSIQSLASQILPEAVIEFHQDYGGQDRCAILKKIR